jgi:hypothetical protein
MTGWDPDFLQAAIDQCRSLSGRIEDCPLFTIKEQSGCDLSLPKDVIDENCGQVGDGICGGVKIQSGPEPATPKVNTPLPSLLPSLKPSPMPTATATIETRILYQTTDGGVYRTEYSTINGRLFKLLVDEVTVTEMETVFVKRSIATSTPVGHGHIHGLPHHIHNLHHGG